MTDHDYKWTPWRNGKRTSEANWRKPRTWNRKSEHAHKLWAARGAVGRPSARPRVMVNADWLDPEVPAEWLADLLALIAATPHLDWLLLTQRPELWRERMGAVVDGNTDAKSPGVSLAFGWEHGQPPANVWIGYSVPVQAEQAAHLLAIPARVRFLARDEVPS